MKNLLLYSLISLLTGGCAHADANYYRFWQGFKKGGLSESRFLEVIPNFMNETRNLYTGRGLNNYLVGLPPAKRASFVPDEFALVAFDNEEHYRAIRATPEGKRYADSHWDYFDKETSKSAPMKDLTADLSEIEFGTAYNVLAKPVNWVKTHVTFYIGLRKSGVSPEKFRKDMTAHIRNVAERMGPRGLQGYLMLATAEYEVAYLAFSSKADFDAAFESADGRQVADEAGRMMDTLMFTAAEKFDGAAVRSEKFYSTTP